MFFSNFAESQKNTRQRQLDAKCQHNALGIERTLPSVPWTALGKIYFAECPTPRTRQLVTVTDVVTGTGRGNGVTVVVTVLCGARDIVCRVFTVRHSTKLGLPSVP